MKRALLLTLTALTSMHFANAQTKTVTVDANDALNNNTKIVAQTSIGQSFFTGHQLGTGYSYPGAGIFRAWTDQPVGSANYYYDGLTNGTINFSVRADGQGYFAGNVGIGTTSPSEKLSISGGNLLLDNALWYSGKNTSGTTVSMLGTGPDNNVYVGDLFGKVPTGNIVFRTNGTDKVMISPNGNVGIGINTPDSKLSVNGKIHSQSVVIDMLGWPDYVFKKDYQLPSLQEVKAYIDQNQHLPEIPSEEQIAKEGLNLGEMNKLLMKKVEELTLYLIEKDKEKIEQMEINNTLKTKLKTQQEQIDRLAEKIDRLIHN